jgi:hypothetical protein
MLTNQTERVANLCASSAIQRLEEVGADGPLAIAKPTQQPLLSFPERTPFGHIPPTTIKNVRYLLQQHRVRVR